MAIADDAIEVVVGADAVRRVSILLERRIPAAWFGR